MENYAIDPDHKIPTLSDAQFNRLRVVAYDTLEGRQEVLYRNCRIIVSADFQCTSEEGKNIGKEAQGIRQQQFAPITFKEDESIVFPQTYSALVQYSKEFAPPAPVGQEANYQPRYCKVSACKKDLVFLVSFFAIYDGFGPAYEQYIKEPDTGITRATPEAGVTIENEIVMGTATQSDIRVTTHLLLLMMGKNFPKGGVELPDHIRSYCMKRLSAVQFAVQNSDAKFVVETATINNMQGLWNSFPKLKKMIFYVTHRNREAPELAAAFTLLNKSSMITIRCILDFIVGRTPTEAHMIPEIWKEITAFEAVLREVEEECGTFWPYFRVLRPNDNRLASSTFPNLSKAAVVYTKAFVDADNPFRRIVEHNYPVVPGLVEKAKKPIDRSLFLATENVDPLAGLREEERAVALRWQIDYRKAFGNQNQREAVAPPNMEDLLAAMMERIRPRGAEA